MIFANKYRPKSLDDIVGQEHLVGKDATLRKIIESNKLPHLFFYGPAGCGKTTLIKDRLARQGRSFEQKLEAYQKKIEELEAKLTPPEVELTQEDFASKAEYEKYLSEQGVKQVKDIARETFNQELTQKELKEKTT